MGAVGLHLFLLLISFCLSYDLSEMPVFVGGWAKLFYLAKTQQVL